jgi:hypothetical protein
MDMEKAGKHKKQVCEREQERKRERERERE